MGDEAEAETAAVSVKLDHFRLDVSTSSSVALTLAHFFAPASDEYQNVMVLCQVPSRLFNVAVR